MENKFSKNFLVWLLASSSPSRVERLYVQFDPQTLTEVQDGFVCVADLEKLIDRPCDLLSCEKAFSFCAASAEVSVGDLLETTCHAGIKNLEVCLQLCPAIVHEVFRSAMNFADSISLIHTICFNRTTCTRGHFTPEMTGPGLELKFCSYLCLGSCVSLHLFWLLHKNIKTFCGCSVYLQDLQYCESC